MDVSALHTALESIRNRAAIETRGKELGAFTRRSEVRTYDVILALLRAPCVERTRTIAAVRRAWEALTGEAVAESTFEDHFNPGLLRLLWELLQLAVAPSPRAVRRTWPPELRRLRDILVCDGTRVALCDAMAGTYAGTTEGKAGLKLLGLYSQGEGAMKDVRTRLSERGVPGATRDSRIQSADHVAQEAEAARAHIPASLLEDAGLTTPVLDSLSTTAQSAADAHTGYRRGRVERKALRGDLAEAVGRMRFELQQLLTSARQARKRDPSVPSFTTKVVGAHARAAKKSDAKPPMPQPPTG